MKIPKTLTIGGHKVKVRYSNDIEDAAQADILKNEILLNPHSTPERLTASLLHEAMHFMNTSISHALLDSLGEQFYQFLIINKLLK